MANNPKKTASHDPEKTAFVLKVAEIHGVSTRYVYRILDPEDDAYNEAIFTTYMNLMEGTNALLEQVKQMVQFNSI